MSTPHDTLPVATGHGLAARLPVAGLGARSYAFIIDWHIRVLLAAAWVLAYFAIDRLVVDLGDGAAFIWLAAGPAAVFYMLYHPVLEIAMQGRTPGKRMTGIRVVRQDGRYATPGAHLVRNVFRLIDSLPALYCAGILCSLFNRRQLRIGDFAAGTLLVYDEHDSVELARVVHQHLAGSPHEAERLALASDLAARWSGLEPQQRQALARSLLARFDRVADSADDAELLAALRAAMVPVTPP